MSPWQNGVAERWVGSCRRDFAGSCDRFERTPSETPHGQYIGYDHEGRTHLGLAKDTPATRPMAPASGIEKTIQLFSRLGGLHRYAVAA